uniref:CD2 associated protein n=1 Tax=Latimeria chalumnae TaxID=7897 RepID=H3B383_LATCH
MVEVIVEFDYEAVHDDELTIRVGDIIKNVKKLEEEGWSEGELNGKKGVFPDNFVKEIKIDTEPKDETLPIKREKTGNVASLVQRMSTYGIPAGGFPSQGNPRSFRRRSKKRQCKVVFDYIPQNEDELELKVGDVIEIQEEVEEGWWSGTLNEKSGIFPTNFVKELEATEDGDPLDSQEDADISNKDATGSSPTSPVCSGNEPATAQPKKIRGVGFGDIFKEGSVKLRPRTSSCESEDKKHDKPLPPVPSGAKLPPAQNSELMRPEPESKPRIKECCKALYSYEGTNDDELSLKEGDIVLIINKETGEQGWWEGELNGKRGVFPDNFVTLLSEPEKDIEKPKKPPPPIKVPASKPEFPAGEKKPLPLKHDEKDEKSIPDQKPVKPAAPVVPPKKPIPPGKANSLLRGGSIPPKRPEKPFLPPPAAKSNGELPSVRPKSEFEPVSFRLKPENEIIPVRPKSTEVESQPDRNSRDTDLINFDDVLSTSEKLSHPTTSRPKIQGRRLPTNFTVSSTQTKEAVLETSLKADRQEEEMTKPKATEVKKLPTPSAPSLSSARLSSTLFGTVDLKPKTEVNNESRPMEDELRAQISDLMNTVESLKLQYRKELADIRKDMEEEKKKRINLEMEIEKLRKIVHST